MLHLNLDMDRLSDFTRERESSTAQTDRQIDRLLARDLEYH